MYQPLFSREVIQEKVHNIFEKSLHKKRQHSLADAALGLLSAEKLQIHHLGEGLAGAAILAKKHATKQIDRLLSNSAIDPRNLAKSLVPLIIGERKQILVSVDWTDFDADKHATLSINMATEHGRSTPLIWETVEKSRLKYNRAHYEDQLLSRLRELVHYDVEVIVLADRGFADHKFFEFLGNELGFRYIIRSKSNFNITDKRGNTKSSKEWLNSSGRMKCLEDVKVTNHQYLTDKFICLQAKAMDDPWYLVSNCNELNASTIVKFYGKRWGIECYFRDLKNESVGWGLENFRVKDTLRRDRLILICCITMILITLLGKAGEVLGFDKKLKVNTSKKRTHSLFRQGIFYQKYFGNFTTEEQAKLMEKYEYYIEQTHVCKTLLGII